MCPVCRILVCTLAILVPLLLGPFAIAEEQQEADLLASLIDAGGTYVGVDVCKECHEDHLNQIVRTKHGQKADSRTLFAAQGCEACHGPGSKHSENPQQVGLISFGGKRPSPLEAQNGICLECHQRDNHLLNSSDTGRRPFNGRH